MKLAFISIVSIHLSCIFLNIDCNAQRSVSHAIWMMPALQYRISDSASVTLQPGWNPQQDIYLIYASSVLKVNRLLDINLGYMFLDFSGRNNDESTFMNGITLKFPAGRFLVDNRNLIWNRFRTISDSYHYNRNRTRIFYEIVSGNNKISPYITDEFSFYFNAINLSRNRGGAGISLNIPSSLNLDLSFVRQWDRSRGNLDILFIVLTKTIK